MGTRTMVRVCISAIGESKSSTVTVDFEGNIRTSPIQHFKKDVREYVRMALDEASRKFPDDELNVLSVYHGEELLSLDYIEQCLN